MHPSPVVVLPDPVGIGAEAEVVQGELVVVVRVELVELEVIAVALGKDVNSLALVDAVDFEFALPRPSDVEDVVFRMLAPFDGADLQAIFSRVTDLNLVVRAERMLWHVVD
jgi:hypothetical protein